MAFPQALFRLRRPLSTMWSMMSHSEGSHNDDCGTTRGTLKTTKSTPHFCFFETQTGNAYTKIKSTKNNLTKYLQIYIYLSIYFILSLSGVECRLLFFMVAYIPWCCTVLWHAFLHESRHPPLTTTKCFRTKLTNAAASSHVDIHPRETRTSPVGRPSIRSCSSQQT